MKKTKKKASAKERSKDMRSVARSIGGYHFCKLPKKNESLRHLWSRLSLADKRWAAYKVIWTLPDPLYSQIRDIVDPLGAPASVLSYELALDLIELGTLTGAF